MDALRPSSSNSLSRRRSLARELVSWVVARAPKAFRVDVQFPLFGPTALAWSSVRAADQWLRGRSRHRNRLRSATRRILSLCRAQSRLQTGPRAAQPARRKEPPCCAGPAAAVEGTTSGATYGGRAGDSTPATGAREARESGATPPARLFLVRGHHRDGAPFPRPRPAPAPPRYPRARAGEGRSRRRC